MIILQDEFTDRHSLPSDYGVDDIPLIVQDRRFNSDGSFDYIRSHRDVMTGLFGDRILVNGTVDAVFRPKTSRVRFRLLNAANARTFTFAFDDGRTFSQVATDGGLIEKPLECASLILAPSERAEIVVEFNASEACTLISLPLPAGSPFATRGMMASMHSGNDERFELLRIEPAATLQRSPEIPAVLAEIPWLNPSDAVTTRKLTLSMAMGMGRAGSGGGNFFINGEAMDMEVVNYRVKKNTVEIWEITNDSMMMHPFHIHHSQFQILERNGKPPKADENSLKDTVKIGPVGPTRVVTQRQDFATPSLKASRRRKALPRGQASPAP